MKSSDDRSQLVSIVMATYNPNLEWFRLQIASLVSQTYKNVEIIILDDSSDIKIFQQIEKIVGQYSTIFLHRNEQNEGSNKTFEKLTLMAHGDYIAYCDQDDIWKEKKIECLLDRIYKEHGVMAYSDVEVIDGEGNLRAKSLTQIRKRIIYREGMDQAQYYIFNNCTAGCSMLVDAQIAKNCIPFVDYAICDHWLAINAAIQGNICFEATALVQYRLHDNNQTGVLKNIYCKKDYITNRVLPTLNIVMELESRGLHYKGDSQTLIFAKARVEASIKDMWRYRSFSKKLSYFEIVMRFTPDFIMKKLFNKLRER